MWNNCCCSKSPVSDEASDWCEPNRKVKGRFGVAFVAETPRCCPEPIGWQVEFCDTPSKVEQRCMEMIQWANCPPLPRCEPCPPVEVVSPCFPPKCNPCCPTTTPCISRYNPCNVCLPCSPCAPCLPCSTYEYTVPRQQSRRKCGCCPATSRKKCNCSRNDSFKKCRCQDISHSDEGRCHCCPRRHENGRRRRDDVRSPTRHKTKPKGNVYDDEIPVKESRQRSKSKDQESSLGSSGNPNEVVPQFMIQAGDIINCNGTGGESIYGPSFEDENFTATHGEEGVVGMANQGPNTNSSQFYITTVPCSHLDGTNMVIGKVRKGLKIVEEIQELPRENEIPLKGCIIEDCGVFHKGQPWNIEENDGTEDVYPPYPEDWDIDCKDIDSEYNNAVNHIKNSGNAYYYKCDYVHSEIKYRKSLRYLDAWMKRNKKSGDPKLLELKSIVSINLAAALLKRKEYKETLKLCSEVLSANPENIKAFMRRGCARMGLREYGDALRDFRHALHIDPNNKVARINIQLAKKHMIDYTKREQELFSKMF